MSGRKPKPKKKATAKKASSSYKKGQRRRNRHNNVTGRTWADFASIVYNDAMNRGHLPYQFWLLTTLFIFWLLPQDRRWEAIVLFFEKLASGAVLGYILWIATLAASFALFKSMRSKFAQEERRIGREKTRWQEETIKEDLGSSSQ